MAKSGAKDMSHLPRVHIEYDVRIGGATKKTELPWVMGIMADLSGNAAEGQPPVSQRTFREVTAATLDDHMSSINPKLKFNVTNKLAPEGEEGGEMPVELEFKEMADFSPAAIARQVEPLRKLLETRERLTNLMANLDGDETAEDTLLRALQDESFLKSLSDAGKAE